VCPVLLAIARCVRVCMCVRGVFACAGGRISCLSVWLYVAVSAVSLCVLCMMAEGWLTVACCCTGGAPCPAGAWEAAGWRCGAVGAEQRPRAVQARF
jgi:hypothetical protein